MPRAASDEKKRVARAVSYVLKRLNSKFVFVFQPSNDDSMLLSIERSGRGSCDKGIYIVNYNAKTVAKMSRDALRQAVLHEWLHSASWELYDEVENLLSMIKAGPLKKELYRRYLDARENVVYHIERSVGPHVFPFIEYKD